VAALESIQEPLNCIAVVAGTGHFRDSLVALLQTLPRVEIAVLDMAFSGSSHAWRRDAPQTVVIVADGPGVTINEAVISLRQNWPEARYVALVDRVWQARQNRDLEVDCVLSKSAPAGELLPAVRELLQSNPYVTTGELRAGAPALERLGTPIFPASS
jgi:DNA-binding NarL/FixJ family response regulator